MEFHGTIPPHLGQFLTGYKFPGPSAAPHALQPYPCFPDSALPAAVHSLRELLFGHMPTLRAALAGFELAGRSVHPFATSLQHFVAKKRSEQPRGGVQNFPVQACLLGNLFSRLLHSARGTARHVLQRKFFRYYQGILAGQRRRLLVRPVQPPARLPCALSSPAATGLLSAVGAPVALARNGLLQADGPIFFALPPARFIDLDGLAGMRHATEKPGRPRSSTR